MSVGIERIAVLGGGAWGTALAIAMQRAGLSARLWMRDVERASSAAQTRSSPYLPGATLPTGLAVTGELGVAVVDADALILAVPARAIADLSAALAPRRPERLPVLLAAKGILADGAGCRLLSEAVAAAWPAAVTGVLTGPSFATEVAAGLPTAIVLAMPVLAQAEALAQACSSAAFRVYASDDIVGAQIGGALKNVIAIACGMVEGAGLGDNARAAVITRGLAELSRLGLALGARPATLAGLSGLGDLVLTCSSMQSRNYSLGLQLGRGLTPAEAQQVLGKTTEGVATAAAALALAAERGVELPIAGAVAAVLQQRASIAEAMHGLLSRPLTAET